MVAVRTANAVQIEPDKPACPPPALHSPQDRRPSTDNSDSPSSAERGVQPAPGRRRAQAFSRALRSLNCPAAAFPHAS
jgi:hypothetical protein